MLELSVEVYPVKGERAHELNKSVSLSHISNLNLDKPADICECPLCGKCFTEKIAFESHPYELHDLPEVCDCNECLDFMLKDCDSETFLCSICENRFKDLGSFNKHVKITMTVIASVAFVLSALTVWSREGGNPWNRF